MALDTRSAGLSERFAGELLRPGDPGYEEARRIHNGMIDKRPALIARCRSAADAAAAVDFAREHGLELSVRGGGHNVAGRAVTEGGVMVDLSPMRAVVVDPQTRTARAQGGATWGDVDRATQAHGLAVTGGMISTTGIGGLTLGGGLGWLMGELGLTVDSLVEAEVVTAGGRVVTASEDEYPDLFWALRGGGGNFGVVTTFVYAQHPVGPVVTGFQVAHPLASAGELLRFYREFTAAMPDRLTINASLIHAPDASGLPLAATTGCHTGPLDEAERDLRPLYAFGSPVAELRGPMEYTVVNSLIDPAYPHGTLNYWKSSFLEDLSEGAIDIMVDHFAGCPSQQTAFVIEHMHGAAARVPMDATAVPFREAGYNFLITAQWSDPAASGENVAWTREVYDAMHPFLRPRAYVNYLAENDGATDRIRAAYGQNYDRLVEVKRTWDPDNLFRLNQNICP